LRIGFISTAGKEILPNIAREFGDLNPEVEFSLRAIPTADQVQMLRTGALDIGFLRLPIGQHSALEVLTLHREPFVLVVPWSHKLAKRKRVRLGRVSGENFVMYARTYAPGFHDLVLGMLRDAGVIPSVSQTAAEISSLISLVDAQMGVAILPAPARLVGHGIDQDPVCYPTRHAVTRPSADHRDSRPTHAWTVSLEGTGHRHDGAPRWPGAHSGGICQLGLKVCSSIATHSRDHEPIFNSRIGRRLGPIAYQKL